MMIAQTLVEYGALSSESSVFAQALNRVESFLSSGNERYVLFLALGIVVLMLVTRRRAR